MQTVNITVSIVSFNTRELLRQCLQSLEETRAPELAVQIIVTDNGSRDGSVDMVKTEFPEVEVLEPGGNLGYGRANNRAFRHARGRYFLILNSDTEVEPGTLLTLVRFMDEHPQAGGCGPQLVWPDGHLQTSWGYDPTLTGIAAEQLMAGRVGSLLTRPQHAPPTEGSTEPVEVEQICGAAQLVRAEAYQQVQGFDPAFFMYHEDVDLNQRLRDAGWKLYFVPAARLRHHLGASSSGDWQTRARMVAALNWSRHYGMGRRQGRPAAWALKALFMAGALLRLQGWSAVSLVRPQHRDRVRLFRQVLRRAARL